MTVSTANGENKVSPKNTWDARSSWKKHDRQQQDKTVPAGGKWWIMFLILLSAVGISGFYAINEYAANTEKVIKNTTAKAVQFESIFGDLVQARFRAMNIAADTMLQSRVTVEAFAKKDRSALIARIEPFYRTLREEHGVAQLNFWEPPATIFYRAGAPSEFGQDLGKFRKSILAANERRQKILAVETGLGGVIAIRAIVPVTYEEKFVGVIEFASDFNIPLERARTITGLQWAIGLAKEVSDRVERPANPQKDALKGTDIFFIYSETKTGEMMRQMDFDPRSKNETLVHTEKQTVFVKSFTVNNFSGIPTIVISTVLDITDLFAEILRSVAIKTGILFLTLSVGGIVGYSKFGDMRAKLTGMVHRQRLELEERAIACDAAMEKLREVDSIKRGFFTNLVGVLHDPLLAVTGQLHSLTPILDNVVQGNVPDMTLRQTAQERFHFALSEIHRLSQLVADYQQLELFRQNLIKQDNPMITLSDVVDRALAEDLSSFRRLPQLSITTQLAADMPQVRADADLLRQAVCGLIRYAAHLGGKGKIIISGSHDQDSGWLKLSIIGSAFAAAGAPDEALIDESRQFIARIGTSLSSVSKAPLVAVVLSRIIVEFYGGKLDVAKDEPGFILRLPTAI
ncbi:MAG: hypothetical protein HQL78_06610 [Magnetococcales bacterium]|nr:hypothetical protein [Magnetococcales bacterium]